MGCIMLVREADVQKMPLAMQHYVKDWFAPKNVLGEQCLIASGRLFMHYQDYIRKGKQPGFAPGHSVDQMEYKEGLASKQSLGDWMRKNEGKLVWSFYSEEPHENVIDDD